MGYEYGGWIIDPTPEFSLGKFFAHARLIRSSPESNADTEKHIERDLARCDTEAEAIRAAHKWAVAWIDERNDGATSTLANNVPAETRAK
ncbi:hypothetical protein [Paraburkholderia aspalathi]|uniref:Uncharacterized protein n=1 Tax=Paraburkholderia aspalathi TaxID=1324617 RepID=A0A1I7ESB4_9BURK|nr:hypothetical protein [Paraburkholderia aspalathi]SFU26790.1 hypothetical protein SAMN05192563_10737 [Paraburkholderia aspalathi]